MSNQEASQETEARTVTVVDGVAQDANPLSVFDAGAGALFAKAIVTPVKNHDKENNAPSRVENHDYTVTNNNTGESMRVQGTTNISPSFEQVQMSNYSPKKIAEAAMASVGDMLDGKMKEAILQRIIGTLDGTYEVSAERKAIVKDDMSRMAFEATITKPCRQDASKVKVTNA